MNIKLNFAFVAHIFSFHVVLVTLAANQCVPVPNNKCTSELGSYNLTRFPNALGHSDYTASDGEFHQFLNLTDSFCSPSLLPFLCSAFYPKCDPLINTVLPPCATECVKSLAECSFLFTFYGFNWPNNLSCDRFSDGSHCPRKYSEWIGSVYKLPTKRFLKHFLRLKKAVIWNHFVEGFWLYFQMNPLSYRNLSKLEKYIQPMTSR